MCLLCKLLNSCTCSSCSSWQILLRRRLLYLCIFKDQHELGKTFRSLPNVSKYSTVLKKKKHASTSSIFQSLSSVHTKTVKRWNFDSIPHSACVVYDVWRHPGTDWSASDITVIENLRFLLSTCKWEADVFYTRQAGERFEKMRFRSPGTCKR